MFYHLRKKKVAPKVTLLLNWLLLIYISIEIFKWVSQNQKSETNLPASYKHSSPSQSDIVTGKMPNIIYILLDCYPSVSFQKEMLVKTNHYLDNGLRKMGFFVIDESLSNYNRTAFSMCSTFQLDYMGWLHPDMKIVPYHYNRAMYLVKDAAFFKILLQHNYQVYNLFIFDMANKPAFNKVNFLSTTTQEIILYNTFINTIRREILWNFNNLLGTTEQQKINRNKDQLSFTKQYNQKVADSILCIPYPTKKSTPNFIYARLLMPHFPYFFDSRGNIYSDKDIYGNKMMTDKQKFKEYIGYTDQKIIHLIQSLTMKYGSNSVVIVQSDYGLTDFDINPKKDAFRNYSAFYFPDKDYHLLYPGMSNVNTFRTILNNYFDQQLPLLKDSTSFLTN